MTVTRSVVPGDWYGVLGDDVVVLLPPAAKARVAGLWEAVDEGAGFDEVLDALISRGLRELPGFVLVAADGSDMKVVIRGPGEARLTAAEGAVTVSGSSDTTWVERNVTGVTAVRLRVAEGGGEAYTVGPGLVRVASVEHPASSAAPVATTVIADADAIAVPVEPPSPPPTPATPPIPAAQPASPAAGEPPRRARILPPDPQLERPLPPPAPLAAAPLPAVAAPGASASEVSAYDPLTSPDLAISPGTPVARLVFSSGEVVDVDRPVVVGRAPGQGRFGGDSHTRLVTVPSPHHEISSTHVEIRPGTGPDLGAAVATDLGSTNGTVVAQPGRPAEDLQPGVAVRLLPGATIDLGEGVTIHVEE